MRTVVLRLTTAVVLALGACNRSDDPSEGGPLLTLTEGSECIIQVTGRPSQRRLYRWLSSQRRLEMGVHVETADGPKPSIFVYLLDEQDRVLGQQQLSLGVLEWQILHTLDELGNPLTYTYEWQGKPGASGAYLNTYDGDRLIRADLTVEVGGNRSHYRFTYEYDDQGRRRYERIDREGIVGLGGPEEKRIMFDSQGRLESVRQTHEHGEKSATTYAYDEASRLVAEVIDGGPSLGDSDGNPDVNTLWSYDSRGRLFQMVSRSRPDVAPVDRDNGEHLFAPGCEAFQSRFPGVFGLPAALTFP